jgi:hypothetical protein
MALTNQLTAIADAIRAKTGGTSQLTLPQMVTAIESISGYNIDQLLTGEGITSISSNVTTLRYSACHDFNDLTTIDLPEATTIPDSAFKSCKSLTSVNIPKATSIADQAFFRCTSSTNINAPLVETISNMSFQTTALEKLDLPSLKSITGNTFYYCSKLTTLILRAPEMVSLENGIAFYQTPILNGTGYIYVPRDLISTYQADEQ